MRSFFAILAAAPFKRHSALAGTPGSPPDSPVFAFGKATSGAAIQKPTPPDTEFSNTGRTSATSKAPAFGRTRGAAYTTAFVAHAGHASPRP